MRKKIKFCVWLGRYPDGPSVKLMISGMVLTKDVKFQGNNVKGARHILSFDKVFLLNNSAIVIIPKVESFKIAFNRSF